MANADEKIFLWINGLAGHFTPVDRFIQWAVSDYLIPVSMALALVGLWFVGNDKLTRQRHQIGVFIALTAMGLSNLSILIINQFYFRPRPFDPLADLDVKLLFYPPTDSSFPSNAVAAAFGIAFSVWGVNHRIGTGFIVGASLRFRPRLRWSPLPYGCHRRGFYRPGAYLVCVQAERLFAAST